MRKISVLDCTLRDGGYINDWNFGFDEAKAIIQASNITGVEYIEVGFIGNHQDREGVVRFSSMDKLREALLPSPARLSAMLYAEDYPVEMLPIRSAETVNMIRVIFWKRNLDEGMNYVRSLLDKGYEVGVQLARTDQYELSEIGDILEKFNDIHPTVVYLVDSFGTFSTEKMMNYAQIYDQCLADDIKFGFHGHNNMQQAFTNTVYLCEQNWKHDLIIDASILGMGRGAGNLNLELCLNYLNNKFARHYRLEPIIKVAERYIIKYANIRSWGYSLPYFLSAITGRNPSYVNYMIERHVSETDMGRIFRTMQANDDGIRFDMDLCDKLIDEICGN